MLSPLGRVPRRRPPRTRPSRRPVPAMVLLLALLVLALGVWWRVLHRGDGQSTAGACPARQSGVLSVHLRDVKVRVYNATERAGLARTVASQLRRRGFSIAATSNDPLADTRQVHGVGELRYGPAGADQARLLSWQFPGIRLAEDPRTDAIVDVAIGPSFRSLASAARVGLARKNEAAAQAKKSASC